MRALSLGIAALLLTCSSALSSDWPCFRGPRHDGLSSETGIRTRWMSPPPVVWQQTVGPAFSSFAIVGDKLYTCGGENEQQVLFCLNADDGTILWKQPFEKMITDPDPGIYGTRSTPTVDEQRVFITGGLESVVCCNARSGSIEWKQSMPSRPNWGHAGSVLVLGDLAIVPGGAMGVGLTAYNKSTGKMVWEAGQGVPGYATPLPITLGNDQYVCSVMSDKAIIVEAETGKIAAEIERPSHQGVNVSSPIWHEGRLFLSTGYGHGCGVYRLTHHSKKVSVDEVWHNRELKNKFETPLLHDGKLYGCDEVSMKCVDFMTGKSHWRKGGALSRGYAHGTMVLAEGHLFLLTPKGELQISRASPSGFKPISKVQILDGRCWTVPVLLNGRLYARNHTKVVCLDMRDNAAKKVAEQVTKESGDPTP